MVPVGQDPLELGKKPYSTAVTFSFMPSSISYLGPLLPPTLYPSTVIASMIQPELTMIVDDFGCSGQFRAFQG